MSGSTRILLVRHGESTWNAVRRWQGRSDPPLTPRGEAQAARAALAAVDQGPFDVVVTSTLRRASRTGEIIASARELPIADGIDAISERSAGEWEGLTRTEIEERFPGFLADHRRPPGYEADDSVVARAGPALNDPAERFPGQTVLAVSHGGVIHALERAHEGEGGWQRLDNLTGRWFEVDDSGWRPTGKRVALVPDGGPNIPPPDKNYT
ncbi:MAG: histidine phosphatase family protein [Ilumatobacter sp.]